MTHHGKYLAEYARTVLEDGGTPAMIRAVEALAEEDGVAKLAPLELGDLKSSGHPTVTSDSHVVYDRPPRQHRLTEAELRAKGQAIDALKRLGMAGHRGGSIEPGPTNVIHGP
jgi:hypothetical protein